MPNKQIRIFQKNCLFFIALFAFNCSGLGAVSFHAQLTHDCPYFSPSYLFHIKGSPLETIIFIEGTVKEVFEMSANQVRSGILPKRYVYPLDVTMLPPGEEIYYGRVEHCDFESIVKTDQPVANPFIGDLPYNRFPRPYGYLIAKSWLRPVWVYN